VIEQPVKSIYVLQGKDEYLRDQARNGILAAALGDADVQMCLSDFDGDVELATVLDELRTLPFLAPHRVVIVRDADDFIKEHRESLDGYFEKPSATATLILMAKTWNKSTRLAKKLKAGAGELISCQAPEAADLTGWVIETFAKDGRTVTPQTARALLESVGSDLQSLRNEIDKLISYTHGRNDVTPRDISAIVTIVAAGPEDFGLTNALIDQNPRKALVELAASMTMRGAEFMILGMIRSHLQKALAVGQEMATGIPTEMKVHPFVKQKLGKLLSRRSLDKLRADMRRLIQVDLNMKSGVKPAAAMQQLLIELCS
jgi:DNA polymerase III subunit delta